MFLKKHGCLQRDKKSEQNILELSFSETLATRIKRFRASLDLHPRILCISCRFELHIGALQVDNQLALTPMPVLMALEEGPSGVRPDSVLKLTLSMQASGDHVQNYPYIGVQVGFSPCKGRKCIMKG